MKPKSANPTFEGQSSHCAPRALFSAFLATAFILQGVLVPVNAESRLSGLESSESRPLGLDEQAPIGSSRALHTRREQNDSAGNSYIERQLNGALQAAGEQLSGVFSNKQQFSSVLDGIKDGEVDLQERLLLAGQERAQSMVDVGLKRLEERLEGRVLRNLELSYRAPFAGREDLFHANATLALWERSEQLLFGQGGLVIRDEKEGANIGLGYRFMAQQDLLLGVNAFYDYLSDPDVGRWSVGAEARSSWLDLYANWYQGTGDDREGDTLYYSPDGWDIEVAAHLPDTPWIEAAASYYTWDGERGQDDLEGQRYRLSFKPSTLVGIGFEYDSPDEGDGSWGVEFDLNYQFGVPLSEQLNFSGNQGKLDLWSRRYEKVEREYAIRVREQRTAVGPSGPTLVFLTTDQVEAGVTVPVPLPPSSPPLLYETRATAGDFVVTENLPGDINVASFNRTPPTLTLSYTGPTPVGTFTITAPASTHTGSSDLVVYRAQVVDSSVPTGPQVGPSRLLAQAEGCSSGVVCVDPGDGETTVVMVQAPITPSPVGSCPTCQIALPLEYNFRFAGTAMPSDDYTVTALTLTRTSNPSVNPVSITLPTTSTPIFTVQLTSVTTHYLNVTLSLIGDDDAVAESIELVNTENPAGSSQTLLTLEPAGTPYAVLEAMPPLDENNLNGSTVTVTLMGTDAEYVDPLTPANFTLTENVEGDVTISNVARTSTTVATLTLTHDGTDISANGALSLTVLASAHTGSGDLNAGSLPIEAAPAVETVAITSTDGPYSVGENIEVTVTFSEAVTVTGAPDITLMVGTTTRQTTALSGTGTDTLVFTYTVAAGDTDADGVSIAADALALNSGTIRDADGTDADLDHLAVAPDTANAVDTDAPTIVSDASTVNGSTITLVYNEPLNEDSTPANAAYMVAVDSVDTPFTGVTIRGAEVSLTLSAAIPSSTPTVTVTYMPGSNPLQDEAGNDAGPLTAEPLENTTGLVASVDMVEITSTGPYGVGGDIDVTVTFSEAVTVTGAPQIALTVGSATRQADYVSGTTALLFRYTVAAGDTDTDGVSIAANALALNGGTIQDSANDDTILTHSPVVAAANQVVDTTVVFENAFTGTLGNALNLSYGTGEMLDSSSTPAVGDYTVTAGGATVTVTAVAFLSDSVVTLTLAAAVTPGQTVTVSYTPGTPPLRDVLGNISGPFTDQPVENLTLGAVLAASTPLTETNLDGSTVTVTLQGTEYMASLDGDDFELTTTNVPGTLTVSNVDRDSNNTLATLTLAYDGTDITGDGTLSVTVPDSANTSFSGTELISNTVTITPAGPPAPGVTVNPTELSVLEASGTNTYTLVLTTAPTADVTIAVESDTDTAATVSPTSLTFSTTDWNTAQTVTVTGVNDDVPGDRTATVTHTATSGDTDYEGVAIDPVTVTVEDDDAAGVIVDPLALTVDEADGTDTYTLVLTRAPTADVTIAVASDTDTAATVSSASLTFTTADWNTAQTVTVTGVNDDVPGDRTATVTHAPTSGDTDYNSVSIASVTVTVTDDDAASAVLAAADPTTLGERRLNSSTNRATVTVTLMNTVYEPSLAADDFTPSDTVGGVTVFAVTRDSDTVATLALAHTGAISSDGTVSVTVLASAHTGSGDLPAGSLPIDATAPTVSSVAFSTTGPYGLGADIEMTITFNENVFVEGTTPNAILSTNRVNRSAPYNRGSGSMELVFRHTVVAGDDDPDGVVIFRSPLLGGGGIIRDAAGNDVGRLLTNSVITGGITQRIDAALPMLLETATVTGTALTLTYNEVLGASTPSTADYMVTVGGSAGPAVNAVTISGMTVTLTLATAVTSGQAVTLNYTPGANPVQDTVGNNAAPLDDQAVSTISGTVSVSLNTIAGDDIVNIAEQAAGFTISGTVADGATVEVTLGGSTTTRAATETGTTWTLDIPGGDG